MTGKPGPVVLFGSGETSAEAQPIHDFLLRRIQAPVLASILETPAGFEINSAAVAGKLAEFLRVRLQNYRPEVSVIPARRRGTAFSPDDPEIVEPLYRSNYLMMGPGSPSYAVRQLRDSLTWHAVLARHRLGCPLVLASAATIAGSAQSLPVYEIYKVGEELHWKPGLDLFGPFGAKIAFIPHWDNSDGGEELDTSRCFMSQMRFASMRALLPADVTIVGIDERTALVVDFPSDECRVMGSGKVTICVGEAELTFSRKEAFALDTLGISRQPVPGEGIPTAVWQRATSTQERPTDKALPPPSVVALVEARAAARASRDWAAADRLRLEIAALGWQVKDSPSGALIEPVA